MKIEINFPISQEEKKKCQSLLNFLKEEKKKNEQEHIESVSEKKDAVWKVEPMVKAIRRNNLKWFCLLILLGGKLEADDFVYLVKRIENESEKFNEKTYSIKFLSKIKDQFDQTLLHHAAEQGKSKCLKTLIGCKLNVDERKTDEGQTSCFFDFKNGKTKYANTLFRNSISVNFYNFNRRTPLVLAASRGHQECVELLIRQGADVNAKDEDDWTPLHSASVFGKVDCLEVLLANAADANARTKELRTPLHMIGFSTEGTEIENKRCVEMLIDAGADIDAKDIDDLTTLHFAAILGKVDCLEVLLANGADVNARTKELWSPLHFIGFSDSGNKAEKERCAEILINAGADVDAKDEDGNIIFYHSFFQTLRVERPDLFIKKTKRKFI